MIQVRAVVLHCSASSWGTVEEIDRWHKERGFERIGYHWVVYNGRRVSGEYEAVYDGEIFAGREETASGAHCVGINDVSIGVCMIGDGLFTGLQIDTTANLLAAIMIKHRLQPRHLIGHCETESGKKQGKQCPLYPMDVMRSMVGDCMLRGVAPGVDARYRSLKGDVHP